MESSFSKDCHCPGSWKLTGCAVRSGADSGALAKRFPLSGVRCRARLRVYAGTRRHWLCQGCRHQTSLTSGTLMAHSRLPLTKWFLATYLITQSKTSIAALALRRQVGLS
jgi:hypothetical protein